MTRLPPPPPDGTTGTAAALWSRTGRALAWAVAFALLVAALPGPEALRWWPDDPRAFLPRLFRGGEGPALAATPLGRDPSGGDETGDLSDEALLALADEGGTDAPAAPDDPADDLPHLPPVPDDADAGPADEEPADAGLVVHSRIDLPPPPAVRRTAAGLPLLPIEDPQGTLRRFYRALDRTAAGEADAVTRVLHYGDSLVMGDYVTQTVRRLLQKKFGDAGHGFSLPGPAWPWYRRDNLRLSASDGWDVYRLTSPTIADGHYGLGGATFVARPPGEWARFEPIGEDLGAAVSRFQVLYLAQPRGGVFEMDVDGRGVEVRTRADRPASRVAEITVPDGPHRFTLRTRGGGEVRLFGVVLERPGPGVVYDSLGINGARARLFTRYDAEHWHEQIRLRRPDLLVLHFGTNESQNPRLGAARYREELSHTVGLLRQALPGVSCLLVAPMDRAERTPSGDLVTRPVIRRIVRVQREVAYAQGCAFWNTWLAMGGEGSMGRWMRMRPPLGGGDLTHPTRRGAERLGAMLFAALMDGYRRHRAAR